MKLYLRTLSPVHIGTGEELTSMDYLVYQRKFYKIDQDRLFQLTAKILPDGGARKLGDWISDQFAAMNETRDNRELSRLNDNMNVFRFFEQMKKGPDLLKELQSAPFTDEAIPVLIDEKTRNRHRDAAVLPLGQVRGMTKNGRGYPYVPGSSLKGSLRSALFFHYLSNFGDKSQIDRILREQLSQRARKERFGLPLTHEAFYCAVKDLKSNRLKTDDEKMDLLKLVRIPDAGLRPSNHPVQLAKINIYLVEKDQLKDPRQKAEFRAVQQPQASYCETIPQGNILETELDFDIEFLLQTKKFIRDGGIPAGDQLQWIGIEKKVKQLFGLDLQTLTEQNKDEKKHAVLQHLMDVWAAFSRRQIASHKNWLDHFGKNDRSGFTPRIEKGCKPVFDRHQQHLLHLGYGTGFQGMTAMLYFLEDARLESLYKSVLETFGIGNKPGNKGTYKVNMERFPKSRRLIEESDRIIRPLGWLEWVDENTPAELEENTAPETETAEETPATPAQPVEPAFFTGKFNPNKPPDLDAVVVVSGRPNRVKVYFSPDNMPDLPLNGYANPLEVGTVIVVRSVVNKKGEVVQVSFGKKK